MLKKPEALVQIPRRKMRQEVILMACGRQGYVLRFFAFLAARLPSSISGLRSGLQRPHRWHSTRTTLQEQSERREQESWRDSHASDHVKHFYTDPEQCVSDHWHSAPSGCWWRRSPHLRRVAEAILNKQAQTVDKGWSSSVGLKLFTVKSQHVTKC
jgi:hypothetical protein